MKPASVSRHNEAGFEIDDDQSRLDFGVIHGFLASSYWAAGIPRDQVERSAANSWCFGVYASDGAQIGYARLVTDYGTFAYLADVFILGSHQGRGLGKWLMAEIFALPVLQGMRRLLLATRTAHGLYEKSGFKALARPEWFMELTRPEIYRKATP
jgi:GNAT superfamily N-acetyltransferase